MTRLRHPMSAPIPDSTLDAILAMQITVAWAGEALAQPPRLGWWQTDVVDLAGGGDLFRRLLPTTYGWATVEAAREAARRVDAQARQQMADRERALTLFALGFMLDERLDERLAFHKRSGAEPASVLPLPIDLAARFDREQFSEALRIPGTTPSYQVVPGGRLLKGAPPEAVELLMRHLAAALLPLPEVDQYPMPFYLGPARTQA